jgi:hypothetical protein
MPETHVEPPRSPAAGPQVGDVTQVQSQFDGSSRYAQFQGRCSNRGHGGGSHRACHRVRQRDVTPRQRGHASGCNLRRGISRRDASYVAGPVECNASHHVSADTCHVVGAGSVFTSPTSGRITLETSAEP